MTLTVRKAITLYGCEYYNQGQLLLLFFYYDMQIMNHWYFKESRAHLCSVSLDIGFSLLQDFSIYVIFITSLRFFFQHCLRTQKKEEKSRKKQSPHLTRHLPVIER